MKLPFALGTALTWVTLAVSMPSSAATDATASVEASIKKSIEERFPDQKIIHVVPAAMSGLYEVYTGTGIMYSDRDANYLVTGSLIDTRTKIDVTTDRLDELNSIDFRSLPFEKAIKVVRGTGAREIAVFTDPDCPYCKGLEKELAGVTDVTIYTFLYPLTTIHPQAAEKARAIWCSPDRAAAWTQWMLEDKAPQSGTCEGNPVDQLVELGQKLNVQGTPTLYFGSGRRIVGGRPSKDLVELMDKYRSKPGPG